MNLLLSLLLALSIAGTPSVRLTHQYEADNDSYFDGRLPKNVFVYLDSAEGNMGLTNRCNGSALCIHLDPTKNNTPRTEALSLLHEECHVWVESSVGPQFDAHDAIWQGCMHRLANQNVFEGIW